MHKIIGAKPIISFISDRLQKENINLFQTSQFFPKTVIDIYDLLKKRYPRFIPKRSYTENFELYTGQKKSIYELIVGSKIKIYVAQNIYNGKYLSNGKPKCPMCENEGFSLNTDILRLEALQFDHLENNKIYSFTSKTFYELFRNSHGDPEFLEKLISFMESKKVELICTNHHNLRHSKYSKIFSYLISRNKILTLSPILIHLIIRESVNSFYRNQEKSINFLRSVRKSILTDLKRKYIIDKISDGLCPICKEFNTNNHISSFQGHHLNSAQKETEPSYLFALNYTCREIVVILGKETVGFICGNCHTVLEYERDTNTLLKIYNNPEMLSNILNDYKMAKKRFIILNNKNHLIDEPFKKDFKLNDAFIDYLFAISSLEKNGIVVNSISLSKFLKISKTAVRLFFIIRAEILKPFIKIIQTGSKTLKRYSLTNYGKIALSHLQYFRDFYEKHLRNEFGNFTEEYYKNYFHF
ncbi:MAG: hypothetical protein ACFFAO_21020 [Candidatus Hermodarchaeota archaeon]